MKNDLTCSRLFLCVASHHNLKVWKSLVFYDGIWCGFFLQKVLPQRAFTSFAFWRLFPVVHELIVGFYIIFQFIWWQYQNMATEFIYSYFMHSNWMLTFGLDWIWPKKEYGTSWFVGFVSFSAAHRFAFI